MKQKLKPCPFCGGEAFEAPDKDHEGDNFAMCMACGVKRVAKHWNTRSDHTAKLEAAEAMIRQLSDELWDEVNSNYPDYSLEYKHNRQKRKNDMETVIAARKLLKGWMKLCVPLIQQRLNDDDAQNE